MPGSPAVTRWVFVVAFALGVALALVVYDAGGPWYAVTVLALAALATGYLALFSSDEVLMDFDRRIADAFDDWMRGRRW